MTFSLNTYPDIFPDLRHPVVRFAAALDTEDRCPIFPPARVYR